ncbi:MAG: ankyrin repeat domain-containing protein, partial [Desulfomonilaceae bacterium]|nr:ankyrin repeat domain-containing protein [Desulfomonilaceae bacterium]
RGAAIDATDTDHRTALMQAARYGHSGVVRVLLEHGADVNHRDGQGNTALSMALDFGHRETARLLESALRSRNGMCCTAA